MSFPPDVFLIGAQRTGTTYLASLLARHPQIVMSVPKEPAFFTIRWDRGLDWYRERFADGADGVHVDATTWYSVAPTRRFPQHRGARDEPYVGVPARIRSVSPQARFLYVLREPVERVYSAYWYFVRQFEERRSLRAALTEDPFYLRTSDYVGQVENFLAEFGIDRFRFLAYEELRADPGAVVAQCLEFVGLDGASVPTSASTSDRNASYCFRAPVRVLGRALGAPAVERLRRGARRLPGVLGRVADSALVRPVPALTPGDRTWIAERLGDANEQLAELAGRDFTPLWT